MTLAERHRVALEDHFTEGELDLEPPEEMAVGEWDDEAILEEELDNEDLLEQDVDEDTLEQSLEVLVHRVDEDDTDEDGDEDVGDQDLEESLDLVLLERMALLDDPGAVGDDEEEPAEHGILVQMHTDAIGFVDVAPCGTDEFVCRSCFLVRKRVQLVDAAAMACHDCST